MWSQYKDRVLKAITQENIHKGREYKRFCDTTCSNCLSRRAYHEYPEARRLKGDSALCLWETTLTRIPTYTDAPVRSRSHESHIDTSRSILGIPLQPSVPNPNQPHASSI